MGPRRQGSAHHGAIGVGGKGGAEQSGFPEFLHLVADGSKRCWVKLAASTASLPRRVSPTFSDYALQHAGGFVARPRDASAHLHLQPGLAENSYSVSSKSVVFCMSSP